MRVRACAQHCSMLTRLKPNLIRETRRQTRENVQYGVDFKLDLQKQSYLNMMSLIYLLLEVEKERISIHRALHKFESKIDLSLEHNLGKNHLKNDLNRSAKSPRLF